MIQYENLKTKKTGSTSKATFEKMTKLYPGVFRIISKVVTQPKVSETASLEILKAELVEKQSALESEKAKIVDGIKATEKKKVDKAIEAITKEIQVLESKISDAEKDT